MATYSEYLSLGRILNAQHPLSENEHDEMLFIIIHQTYELWFKQVRHEGDLLKRLLVEGEIFQSLSIIDRILTIMRTLVKQTDILETMSPNSFASIRKKLDTASGLQSLQFKLLECWFGFRDHHKLKLYANDTIEFKSLYQALHEPSLYDCFLLGLKTYFPGRIPNETLERDFSQQYEGNSKVQNLLIEIYRNKKEHHLLCEKMVDLDEGFQEWRYRHIKMVERTIGASPGTGKTSGVEYLKQSLFRFAFSDLWNIRTKIQNF